MSDIQPLSILYEDSRLIAVHKPHGLLVHRSPMAPDATEFALQIVRDMIDQRVYLAHRLDRKTSGVLLFAKDKEANSYMHSLFHDRKVTKKYTAIVRGYTEDNGIIDYPLMNEKDKIQEATTHYTTIEKYEIDLPHGKHNTSRYSHVELQPQTGRFHQLRKHMAHIFHPIIGDRPHGCNKQNRLWKETYDMTTMMLHAAYLEFTDMDGQDIVIEGAHSTAFDKVLKLLRTNDIAS